MSELELARFALRIAGQDAAYSIAEEEEREGDRPNSRNIVRGVLYSRRFVATYNVVVLAVILGITIRHWTNRMRERRTRNKTTLRDNDTRKTEDAPLVKQPGIGDTIPHESSPLLGQEEKRVTSRPSLVTRMRWSVSSWLMYQPRPIPIVKKALPANLTSVAITLFILLNAFFFFYNIPFVHWAVYVFADRAGLLFVANLPLLYLFSAKNCPLKSMTGFSYENLNIFHRRLGELLCIHALIHATLFLYIWYDELRPIGFTFWQLLSSNIIWLGFCAFACYGILYLTSLASFRAAFYEVFLASHILLQTGGLSFLFFHHHFTRPYVSAALAIFLADRLLYRLFLARHTTKADLTILPDDHTLLLSTNFPLPGSQPSLLHRLRSLKPDITPGWSPADHIFISIPSLPFLSAVQSHPFTIASTAPSPAQSHAWLDLIIRSRSGFSRTLLEHARKHHRVDVAIDGPYGSHHALDMARSSSTAVFVAGGSGIAVVLPLAWDLLTSSSTSASTSASVAGAGAKAGEGRGKTKVVLIWVVHDAAHIEWIGQERLRELVAKGCEVVMPEPTRERGRPDMVRLMAGAMGEARGGVGVVVSGPDGMNREVNNICAAMRGRGVGVKVSVEKFGW